MNEDMLDRFQSLVDEMSMLDMESRIEAINSVRWMIHQASPFSGEPVDYVYWAKSDSVTANDYNPNSVAPPEMELLRVSIMADGYTQPIVTMPENGGFTVVDGFHRTRVGKESKDVNSRVLDYLPVVRIKQSQEDRGDRIAATIRHNRARGKHRVEAMSDIVIELKRRNWSDEKIGKNLGMDPDEVLRLCQITGIAEAFKDQEFSEAWEVGDERGAGAEILSDIIEGFAPKADGRKLHTWDRWECYRSGFYAERCPNGISQEEGEEIYRDFLSDLTRFRAALEVVVSEWRYSCEHFLTNDRMNRIAWLGQASVSQAMHIPSICRGGYHRLTEQEKNAADMLALEYLNRWLVANGREEVTPETAFGRTEMDLY
jgi:ParB-like chromosome segregation protein Spo0J